MNYSQATSCIEADMGDPDRVARAFDLADRAMVDTLRDRCVLTLELGDSRLFPASAAGDEVSCVADSAPEIVEALAWLSSRGMAKVESDEAGKFITLVSVHSGEGGGSDATH